MKPVLRTAAIALLSGSLLISAKHKENKGKKSSPATPVFIEAHVIKEESCGYLLKLPNGQLLKPQNLPRKFRDHELKVLVRYEKTDVADSLCSGGKPVHITEIKRFRLSPNLRASH
jgi:hypothetical protein